MGSRIACHFANVGTEVLLLDIPPKEGQDKNKIVNDALAAALKSSPSPIYDPLRQAHQHRQLRR
jgi:3-hydroxyacyl-CoA dehydrogenase